MNILVTGGAGFIGSHTVLELLEVGHDVIVIDNFINSSRESLARVEEITQKKIKLYEGDIQDKELLRKIFSSHSIDACIHFAALKAVGESVHKPIEYYENNLSGTLTLIDVMNQYECKNLIFSSSATVYGNPAIMPITEDYSKGDITNPYGQTKSMIEQILSDIHNADLITLNKVKWNIVILRYFNPIGAHPSGFIGEDPSGVPNNIMPYITQVAAGKLKYLNIYGNDYDTSDGTGIRDYIHVVDLAKGHVQALKCFEKECQLEVFNLGTGKGYSVLELVKAFESATGIKIKYKIVGRRAGDIAKCYADVSKAKKILGWTAKYNVVDMCRDSWNWQKNNPDGYSK